MNDFVISAKPYEEYTVVADFAEEEDSYTQSVQNSKTEFSTVVVDHNKEEILVTHRPFSCRGFFNEFIFKETFPTAPDEDMYGFMHTAHSISHPEHENFSGFLALMTKSEFEVAQNALRNLELLEGIKFIKFPKMGFKYENRVPVLVGVSPELMLKPFAVSLITCLIRCTTYKHHITIPQFGVPLRLPDSVVNDAYYLRICMSFLPLGVLIGLIHRPFFMKFLLPFTEENTENMGKCRLNEDCGIASVSNWVGVESSYLTLDADSRERDSFPIAQGLKLKEAVSVYLERGLH